MAEKEAMRAALAEADGAIVALQSTQIAAVQRAESLEEELAQARRLAADLERIIAQLKASHREVEGASATTLQELQDLKTRVAQLEDELQVSTGGWLRAVCKDRDNPCFCWHGTKARPSPPTPTGCRRRPGC